MPKIGSLIEAAIGFATGGGLKKGSAVDTVLGLLKSFGKGYKVPAKRVRGVWGHFIKKRGAAYLRNVEDGRIDVPADAPSGYAIVIPLGDIDTERDAIEGVVAAIRCAAEHGDCDHNINDRGVGIPEVVAARWASDRTRRRAARKKKKASKKRARK